MMGSFVAELSKMGGSNCRKGHPKLDEEWTTNGKEAIWVGRSDQISQGHISRFWDEKVDWNRTRFVF